MSDSQQSRLSAIWAGVRERPQLVISLLVGSAVGAGLALYLPVAPDDMSLIRRAVGGALAGLLFIMCALGFRLYD